MADCVPAFVPVFVPVMINVAGLPLDPERPLTVTVVVCPVEIAVGLNEQVTPLEQEKLT